MEDPEAEPHPVVGEKYRGSIVVKIDEESSKRANGLTRVRRSIQLASGMILLEDVFIDERNIQGEYKELEYKEVPSPTPYNRRYKDRGDRHKKKRKPKIPSLDDDQSGSGTGSDHQKDKENEERKRQQADEEARLKAEEEARRKAEEEARKEQEARELRMAHERAMQREQELQRAKEEEEKRRREDEQRRLELERRREEERRLEKERQSEMERRWEEKRRLEQKKRMEETKRREDQRRLEKERQLEEEKRREEQRRLEQERQLEEENRQKIVKNNWKPEQMLVYSPASKIRRRDDRSVAQKNTDSSTPHAVWMYGDGNDPDEDFDWWAPTNVIVHPPGKPIDHVDDEGAPHGLWAYAPGMSPSEDDDEWNPSSSAAKPCIILFPPGVEPTSVDGKKVEIQGEWSYPNESKASFPPLPTPKNEWDPKTVKVYAKPKIAEASKTSESDNVVCGMWMVHDGDGFEQAGDEEWRVAEIQVYPQGQEPQDISDSQIQGVWGLAPGATPNEDGEWAATDLWFFAPGDAPSNNEDWNPQGIWTHSPGDSRDDWPPLSQPQDEWEPKVVWVVPPSQIGEGTDEGWNPTGVWNFGDRPSGEEDSEDWAPFKVVAYPNGQEPENLEDYKIHGMWGLSPGAEKDEDGEWKASDIWFVGPGQKVPENWNPQGVWTVSSPSDEDDEDWPPKKRQEHDAESNQNVQGAVTARVYRPSTAPQGTTDNPCGIWMFGDRDGNDEPDWIPLSVLLYETGREPEDLDPESSHGLWGYAPGAEPDSDGKFKPSDMWIVAPGKFPDDGEEWMPMGTWTISPGDECVSFSDSKSKPNRCPSKVWVYPKRKVPKDIEKGVAKGVWSYKAGKKVMDAGKKPMQVNLFEKGKEPKEIPTRHGFWGYAKDAKPDMNGDYLPEDMLIFAVGEAPPPDEEWQPRGVWAEPPPPPKQVSPKKEKEKNGKTERRKKKENKPLERCFEKSAWVYPSKEKAPAKAERKNPQGCWTQLPWSSEDDAPQEILMYTVGHEPADLEKLPHGAFGYAPGSKPDENGMWSPRDMLFFPPGHDPPPDLQNRGTWTYPNGSRIETTYNYRWEGDTIVNIKSTVIQYMDQTISFTKEWK